ncbi:hypothetical protein F4776DRAFT_137323 [Hypoxylon sp. NC0597]|nr:hypothetical protein F4776DRAFT_137323 [Hypoxylon sp. NC0597]
MPNEQVKYEEELYEDENNHQEPGATIMWFGKFEGTRLDQLTDNYRWTMYRFSLENNSQNWVRFRELHDEYMNWLDERRSPLSTIVWFGKYKGHELRVLYTRPRRWSWLIRNCTHWAPALKSIAERYRAYKQKHPRKPPISRGRPIIANPTGESLGPMDDRLASDNDESYDSDDGFVARSDEEIEEDEGNQSDLDDLLTSDEEEQDEETVCIPPRQFVQVDADNSDDSLPSLNEIVQSSPAKRTPNKSKHGSEPFFMRRSRLHVISPSIGSSPNNPRVLSSSDDDDEPLISPFKRIRRSHIVLDSDYESRESSKAPSDCIVVGRSSQTPGRTKNTPSTIVVVSSNSDTDDQADESRNPKSRPSAADTTVIDSDDEPLVPKLRRERMEKGKL